MGISELEMSELDRHPLSTLEAMCAREGLNPEGDAETLIARLRGLGKKTGVTRQPTEPKPTEPTE